MIQSSKNKEKVINNTMGECSKQSLNKGNKGKCLWILDTRATYHVTCSISLFMSYHKIKPVKVKLPNNQNVTIVCVGTIFLSKNIILHNVLYIPKFTLYIIFVQHLMLSLKCQLVFTHNVCQIQEKDSLKMMVKPRFEMASTICMLIRKIYSLVYSLHNNESFESAHNLDIWHCRMIHSSNRVVLECLAKKHSDIKYDKMNICAPCQLAKQHKLPFPLSKTSSQNAFDLVHMDI